MANLNKVMLLGNLTRDPDLRYAPQGTAVARLGLAVNHRYGQGEAVKEETMFIDVVVFGRQAEAAGEHLAKGRPVLIEGRLKLQNWEDKEGRRHAKHEVVADRIQFLGARSREDSAAAEDEDVVADRRQCLGTRSREDSAAPTEEEDIPF